MNLCLAFLLVAAICHGKPVRVLFISLFIYLFIYLFVYLFVYLFIYVFQLSFT